MQSRDRTTSANDGIRKITNSRSRCADATRRKSDDSYHEHKKSTVSAKPSPWNASQCAARIGCFTRSALGTEQSGGRNFCPHLFFCRIIVRSFLPPPLCVFDNFLMTPLMQVAGCVLRRQCDVVGSSDCVSLDGLVHSLLAARHFVVFLAFSRFEIALTRHASCLPSSMV